MQVRRRREADSHRPRSLLGLAICFVPERQAVGDWGGQEVPARGQQEGMPLASRSGRGRSGMEERRTFSGILGVDLGADWRRDSGAYGLGEWPARKLGEGGY